MNLFRIIAFTLLILSFTTWHSPCLSQVTSESIYNQVETILSSYFPAVVGYSPDGRMLLLKDYDKGLFHLKILDLNTNQQRTINSDKNGQLGPRWSKKGNQIAYFLEPNRDKNHTLYIYDIDSNKHTSINYPKIFHANGTWSFDDRYFATYTAYKKLIILDLKDKNKVKFISNNPLDNPILTTWSEKSDKIAYIEKNRPHQILVYDVQTSYQTTIPLNPNRKVIATKWLKDSDNIMISSMGESDINITKVTFNSTFNSSHTLNIPYNSKLSGMHLVENDKKVIINYRADLADRFLILDTVTFKQSSYEGNVPVVLTNNLETLVTKNSSDALIIYKKELNSNKINTVYHQSHYHPTSFTHEIENLSVHKNIVPIVYWRNMENLQTHPLLIILKGGQNLVFDTSITPEIHSYIANKIDVLIINYNFLNKNQDNSSIENELINSSIDNALDKKKYNDIFIYGDSYASTLALRSYLANHKRLKGLYLANFVPGREIPLNVDKNSPSKFLAFQGTQDYICSPQCAKRNLQIIFKFKDNEIKWFNILQDEGHSFHRIKSLAEVYSKIIKSIKSDRH